jgi:hypothetical protein
MLAAFHSSQTVSRTLLRGLASISFPPGEVPFTLPELGYEYSALEPHISAEIMELHHSKHHQTYVHNYNKLMAQAVEAEQKQDSHAMAKLNSGLHFNGGGVLLYSHLQQQSILSLHIECEYYCLFWVGPWFRSLNGCLGTRVVGFTESGTRNMR